MGQDARDNNTRIKSLDDFKWIAAFLVAAIHTSPLESVNEAADFLLTRVIARTAVPFFFMVTGYFVLHEAYRTGDAGKVKRFLKKLGKLYLAVTLCYLPVQLYRLYRMAGGETFGKAWVPRTAETLFQVVRAVFFDGTYYHLWYLPAVGLGLVLALGGLKRLGVKGALTGAGILYLLGLLGDSYYGLTEKIPVLRACYDGLFRIFSYTRNGIFFAPLFLLLGALAADEKKRGVKKQKHGIVILMLMLMMCGEGLLLRRAGWQRHDSMYLLLPFVMISLFALLADGGAKDKTGGGRPVDPMRKSFYEKGPMLLYCAHPAMILAVRGAAKITGWGFLYECSPLYYLLVTGGSLGLIYLGMMLVYRKTE